MNPRRVTKPLLGHFLKAGVHPKKALQEFLVTPDAVLPVGHEITARHFSPGQIVDVTGMTTGKGFQGPMKRWGFRGQPASHGVSVTHRSHGGTGNRVSFHFTY
jgi:large subunit ribosomal protein L3